MSNKIEQINKIDKNTNVLKGNIKSKTINKQFDKKMDKSIIQNIQLIIRDLVLNGELNNDDLLDSVKLIEIKNTILELLKSIIDKKSDLNILNKYEDCILNHLKKSVIIDSPIYNESIIENLENQIKELKKIPQPEQRTPEWYIFRNNRLTASDLGTIIGVNPYEQYNTILLKKCGVEKPFYMNKNILRGVKYEEVICNIYEYRNCVKVFEYGCIPHPIIGHFGASPDGIVDIGSENKNYLGRMLEIKCPGSRPITGFIPGYYHAQVQGQLEVCDLDYCDFVECKIAEYTSDDEYYNDYYKEDDSKKYYLRENGLEKGVVVEAYNKKKEKNKFYYSKLGLNRKEIKKWENECFDKILEDDNMEYLMTTYWKATEYNELLIKRDKEWFNKECVPKINKFWDDVLKYRKRPLEEIKELLNPKKTKTVIESNKMEKYFEKNEISNDNKKTNNNTTSIDISNNIGKNKNDTNDEYIILSDSD